MTPYFDGALIKRRAQGLDKRDRSTTKDGDLKASINSLIQLLCQRDCNNKKNPSLTHLQLLRWIYIDYANANKSHF